MKKRILSAILCLAMVATMLITPIAAVVDLTAETVPAIADNSSLSMLPPDNGTNAYHFYFNEISENATITFYFKPSETYMTTASAPYIISLCSGGTYSGAIAKFISAADTNKTAYMGAEGRGIYWWAGYRGPLAQPLVTNEWNRYDLQIDFTNKKATGYLNYTLIETVDFLMDATSFDALIITNDKGGYNPDSRAYFDNLIITKGLNAPKANDVAAGVTAEKLVANKANILHADTFDTTTQFIGNANTKAPGNVCTAKNNSGFLAIDATVGMTAKDKGVVPTPTVADNSSFTALVQNASGSIHFYLGDITENFTITLYYMPGENFLNDVDAFTFMLRDSKTEAMVGGISSGYQAPSNGGQLFMRTASQNHNWNDCAGAPNVQPVRIAEWNRLDIVVDFDNNQLTGYVNYVLLETVPFMADTDSIDSIYIPAIANGYRAAKRGYFDNLVVTKGLNAPATNDFASAVTGENIVANIDNIIVAQTFEPGTAVKTGSNTPTFTAAGEIWLARADSNTGFGSMTASVGMTKDTVVIPATKPGIVINENTSLRLTVPNAGGQFRIYFGDITESATLTWYIKAPQCYADLQDALCYMLYDDDTVLGGFESNPWGGQGMYLHMNTATADQGPGWSGATGANTSGKLTADKWARVDLVVDCENNTITGYVNYKAIQTLAIPEDASFNHLRMDAYVGGYQDNKYLFMDNLMLRDGAQAPSRSDVAANADGVRIANDDSVLNYMPMNSSTVIVHGTTTTEFETNKVYNWRADANGGFCSINSTIGMNPQTGVAEFRGHQDTTEAAGDDFAVRFVGTVIDYTAIESVGFDISLNGGEAKELLCTNIYSKLLGSADGVNVEYTALGDFGAGYIYALTFTGLSFTGTYEFEVTPFTYDLEGNKTSGETYTVTYNNGVLQ